MKEKISEIIVNVILALFGVFLIFWAEEVTNFFSILAGIVITAYGITKIVSYFNDDKDIANLILGVIIIVLGGVLIFKATFLRELLSFIVGIYILISAVASLTVAIKFMAKNSIILSSICIVIGFLCIIGKFLLPDVFLQIIGVMLVAYSIINIINLILLKDNKPKITSKKKVKVIDVKEEE